MHIHMYIFVTIYFKNRNVLNDNDVLIFRDSSSDISTRGVNSEDHNYG